jgi:iron complex outermembrane recepter protein
MMQRQVVLTIASIVSIGLTQTVQATETKKPQDSSILRVRDGNRPAMTVKEWVAQIETAIVSVTVVTLNRTEGGLEIVLETADGKPLQVDATMFRAVGNSLIADIPKATLALTNAQAFSAENPTADIARVDVTQVDASNIRVSVTGQGALPKSEVTLKTGGLAYSLNPEGEGPDEEIVVTGERNRYRAPNASTATKTDTPIRDIPQSIQVVPQQVIEDQQTVSLEDALRNVSGVRPANNNVNVSNQATFNLRGFSQGSIFRNGFPTRSNSLIEVAGIEQIEVLKGPASVLYGQSEPGGIINIVTKKPLENPFYSASFQIGSYQLYRPTLDISATLTDDKSILLRMNLAYTNAGSFRDFVDSESIYVAPVLTFKFSDQTRLMIDLEYLSDDRTFDNTIPVIGKQPGDFPISRFLGEPGDKKQTTDFFAGYLFEHDFSENWKLRNAFRYHSYQGDREVFRTGSLRNDNRTLNRTYQDFSIQTKEFSLITDVVGKFSTGSVKHIVLLGIDLRRQELLNQGRTSRANLPIDVFNPIYGTPIPTSNFRVSDFKETTEWAGIYVQDQISLLDNLIIVLGGRFDFVNNINNFDGPDTDFQDNAFSPRVGIVYRPIEPISLYASYAKSFNPQSGFTVSGSPLEPTTGEQFEIGVKTEFLNGKLATTLAYYDLAKQNIATEDPNNPDFSVLIGEQRSRGVELDIAGELAPGFNLIASYAYTNARITRDNTGLEGLRPFNAPEHTGSLWLTYEFQLGSLKGLGLGTGVFAVSRNEGRDGTYFLPGYTTIDLAAWYKFSIGKSNARVQLNVKNLFDTEYYESTSGRTVNQPGAPLTLIGRFSVEF